MDEKKGKTRLASKRPKVPIVATGLRQTTPKQDLFEQCGDVIYYGLAPGQVPCANCQEVVATLHCVQCEEDYCRDCTRALHPSEELALHRQTEIKVKSGSQPATPKKLSDTMEVALT